jgi:hypothetical protein
MSLVEEIESKVRTLPPELQAEVLDFVEFLAHKGIQQSFSSQPAYPRLPNKRGAGKEVITYVSDDFDAHLNDFNENK